jgi:UDP-N-acetylmuramoyl-L-alanyl-D-glutamate--2,6-diaminopimelate ligase
MADGLPPPPPWKSDLLTVGVTGTNGKTTTTRLVAAALGSAHRPVVSTTTVGSFLDDEGFAADETHDGFLALLRAGRERGGRFAALEMTSEALARGFAVMWPCEIAVFTNLSHDHLDAHGSPEHYLASKAQLFLSLPPGGTAVLNGRDPASALLAEIVPGHARTVRYGLAGPAADRTDVDRASGPGGPSGPSGLATAANGALDVTGDELVVGWDGTRVRLALAGAFASLADGAPRELRVRAVGAVFAENALAAFTAALAAGVPAHAAASALGAAAPPPGRFEIVSDRPRVVVDYAHTPDALARTLAAARALTTGKLVVVFGAGGNRDRAKRGPMGRAAGVADRVVLTSDNPRDEAAEAIAGAIRDGIPAGVDVIVELDRRRAIAVALEGATPGDVIVVAGRGHETEQIIGTERRRFSDVETVRELVEGLGSG